MIEMFVPGRGEIKLGHAVFDVNGTLAVDGELLEGVAERLERLGENMQIHMLTADTHGKQAAIDAVLGHVALRVQPGNEAQQKADFVNRLGADNVVAIGNGGNDAGMLKTAAVGIAVIGTEGLNVVALQGANVVCTSILDALDLLLKPTRLVATLRH
jgi:P-type E1-E2 ATPase